MRLLPDHNFKENYRKYYDENYKKFSKKLDDASQRRAEIRAQNQYSLKNTFIGGLLFVIIFGIFIAVGLAVSSGFSKKEQEIADLTASVQALGVDVTMYKQRDAAVLQSEVDALTVRVCDLQTQYRAQTTPTLSDDVVRYLGTYDYDWSKGIATTDEASWRGYLNTAGYFADTIDFVFILYDGEKPVYATIAVYELDNRSHIGDIKSVRGWSL